MEYTKKNIVRGAIIYSAGDTIAALLLHEFSWNRLLGMVLIGATVYAFEIPNYFKWIDKRTADLTHTKLWVSKTLWAILYFNPIWIARHLLFIKLFEGDFDAINIDLLRIASWSFLFNIPISFIANAIIQNKIKISWRFMASAIFSALMAIYYAMSLTIFK